MRIDNDYLEGIKVNSNYVKKLMERKKDSRKGENGKLLIIGGSEEYTGAVALAGLAALRAGCDTVTIAAPAKVAWAINQLSPDLITKKFPGPYFTLKQAKELVKLSEQYDAVLIGPGLSRKAEKFALLFIRKCHKLKIIDADALKPLSFKDFSNSLITPHHTELETMLINSHKEFLLPKLKEGNVKEIAEVLQGNLRYFLTNENVLLIKGPTDMIISKNRIAFNRTGNPGMAKAGTGDVLAGLAAGLVAKNKDLFKSAVAAAYINGSVGDLLLKRRKGYTFLASDLVRDLEEMMKKSKKRR